MTDLEEEFDEIRTCIYQCEFFSVNEDDDFMTKTSLAEAAFELENERPERVTVFGFRPVEPEETFDDIDRVLKCELVHTFDVRMSWEFDDRGALGWVPAITGIVVETAK